MENTAQLKTHVYFFFMCGFGELMVDINSFYVDNVTKEGVRLNADIVTNESFEVFFEYRLANTITWFATSVQTISSDSLVQETIMGLESLKKYEFRVVVG